MKNDTVCLIYSGGEDSYQEENALGFTWVTFLKYVSIQKWDEEMFLNTSRENGSFCF